MPDFPEGVPDDLDLMLRLDEACGFNHTVITQDGAVHGFLAHHPRPWPKTDPRSDGSIEIYGGDQLLFKVQAVAEAGAYLYGVLVGFCGGDLGEAVQRLTELGGADPYKRMVELHKLGWCPIWNESH